MLLQRKIPSPNKNFHDDDDDDNDSLTDVSVIIQTKPLSITSKYSIEYKPITQTDNSVHDQLFQSLIAYVNSFNFDEIVYSIQDFKNQLTFNSSIKQKLSTVIVQHDTTKLIPSREKIEDYNSDENTTVTDDSKFDWENFHSNKSSIKNNLFSPIIIREKTKDCFLPQNIDIQVLHSSTPIIVREILHKPSQISKNHLPLSSITFSQHHQSSKPPIIPKHRINNERISSIQRVKINEYVQKYGSSLYSKEVFHHLFL